MVQSTARLCQTVHLCAEVGGSFAVPRPLASAQWAETNASDAAAELDRRSMGQAAAILAAGGTVAFPTETVYGLGANALDARAVEKIFAAKQRPGWDPLIVHVADRAMLEMIADIPVAWMARVEALIAAFWPGPLTLLLPRSVRVPNAVTAGRALVGVRMPAHAVALELIRLTGVPIAAPSANRFGHTSPTKAAHVVADLDGRIDAILDGGATDVGVESTVLDLSQTPPVVYRPGAVTIEALAKVMGVLPMIDRPGVVLDAPESLPSPGVGLRHYAPQARLLLIQGCTPTVLLQAVRDLLSAGMLVGVMLPQGWQLHVQVDQVAGRMRVFNWGEWADHGGLARRLFEGLRALDDERVAAIICPVPQGQGIAEAIRDRLEKAARIS